LPLRQLGSLTQKPFSNMTHNHVRKMEGMMDLLKKIEKAINEECRENDSDTPDFILAEYLMACLKAFEITVFKRDKWYGFKPWPDGDSDAVSHSTKVED